MIDPDAEMVADPRDSGSPPGLSIVVGHVHGEHRATVAMCSTRPTYETHTHRVRLMWMVVIVVVRMVMGVRVVVVVGVASAADPERVPVGVAQV